MKSMRFFGIVLTVAFSFGLSGCGVYQIVDATAHPDDDNRNMAAAMDILVPPMLITGDWPSTYDRDIATPQHYAALIRSRHDGRMSAERARDILDAMDRVFASMPVGSMTDTQLDALIGPPDKKVRGDNRSFYFYQFTGPEGLQGRCIARK